MTRNLKRKVAAGVLVAAVAGAGAAVAAAHGPGGGNVRGVNSGVVRGGFHGDDELATVTSYLGITADALRTQLESGKTLAQIADATSGKSAAGLVDALVAAEKKELAAAVTAGKLTQAQADARSANLTQRVTAFVNGTFPARGPGLRLRVAADTTATITSYLGITLDALKTQLQSGKTLAQIADATSGKSAAGLTAALVAAEKKALADAVTAGKLTQAQADALSANVTQRVTDLVNGTFPGKGPGHHGFGGDELDAVTSYLGVTADALRTQLQSGKTLAQVADATTGKSASGLVAALVAAEKKELADAVTAGKLTQAQADALSANLTQRFTALVDGTLPARPGIRGFGPPRGGLMPAVVRSHRVGARI